MNETKEKLIKILKTYSFNEPVFYTLTDESDLKDDLDINSARIIDIVLDIEEEFKIEIDDKAITKIRKFGDIVEIINSKINK